MNAAPRPRLQLVRGEEVLGGREMPAEGELILGRTDQCDLVIAHASVSRMHARIFTDGGHVYIEDLGSANGTFVDGTELAEPHRLRDGQMVRPGQKTERQPVQLRFEDPASRLLKEMGLYADAPDTTEPPRPAPAPVPAQVPVPAASSPAESEADDAEPEPATPDRSVKTLAGLGGAAVVVALVLTIWLRGFFAPSATFWRSVQINPPQTGPGGSVAIESPDIEPTEDLVVTLAGEPVTMVEVVPGRLSFTVPPLPGRNAGEHRLPLTITVGELDVATATLNYRVEPEIRAVSPTEVSVGHELVLEGSGFAAQTSRVSVIFGTTRARVLSASPTEVRVRVPVVARTGPMQVPVRLRIDDWEIEAPSLVTVEPKTPEPLPFVFTAAPLPGGRVWEVRHPLGRAFLLAGAGEDTPPANVQATIERLGALFEAAEADPALRVVARSAGGGQELRAGSTTLVRFSAGDLDATREGGGIEASHDMLVYWMAGVLNDLLDVFARGRPVEVSTTGAAYAGALNRLVTISVENGGQGRPEELDLESLTVPDRTLIGDAFLTPPAGFGDVSGRWLLLVERRDASTDLELTLDLRQNGRRLSGRADARLVGANIELRLSESSITGTVEPGAPLAIRLEMSFNRPVGAVVLEGTVGPSGMVGSRDGNDWSGRRLN